MKALFEHIINNSKPTVHKKILNSSNEVILFINKIIQQTECILKYLKDIVYYLALPQNNFTNLYTDVFYSCFQDIYALEYIIRNPPAHYFTYGNVYKILDKIYLLKLEEIEDKEKWLTITSDDCHKLFFHPLLPYPEDFRKEEINIY